MPLADKTPQAHSFGVMDVLEVECPTCGEQTAVELYETERSEQVSADCQVCCRPFRVTVHRRAGEWQGFSVEHGW